MTSEKGSRRDKNQNIQVFVRLRPLNQRERDIKSLGVIEVSNGREVVVRQSQQSIHTKKFTFDRAFGPNTKQIEVYQQVVSPLIQEVLCGYNCTVFAYGQTGTGKTHTMVGESTGDANLNWQNDPLAGIIPRALSQLFDELRISNTEYTVRVSYLELYNEELFDLLSTSEDNSKLRIYEDVTRKGANIVNGLEEITVYNKNEVYKIMEQGQERKRVASTLMNAQSSRSHTVFTIVAHMKENNQEGEELVKIGKLNLVDLAGSENISKAGSDNPAKRERARECVNINQSLLTLGRVITALVERHPHIPYRESKLTRILQESLGGRTKTSIIATISPGHKDIEETMSTLEYAHRAKNIQNKPEVNQKMTKTAMLKEYAEEIDKLKRDLTAARDKNGVCISNETFAEMNLKDEEQRKEIQELLLKKRAMEEERDRMEAVYSELNNTLQERVGELDSTRKAMQNTQDQLANTKNALQSTVIHCEEQKHLVSKHRETEQELSAQARDIIAVADTAAAHAHRLHDTVDKRKQVESKNVQVTRSYRQQAGELRGALAAGAQLFLDDLLLQLHQLRDHHDKHTARSISSLEDNQQKLEELVRNILEAANETKVSAGSSHDSLSLAATERRSALQAAAAARAGCARAALQRCVAAALHGKLRAEQWDAPHTIANLIHGWISDSGQRVGALQRAHATFHADSAAADTNRIELYRRQRDARRQRLAKATASIDDALAQLESEKMQLENRLTKQLTDIEQERCDAEARLERWAEQERERLARHVEAEKLALEERLARRVADVEAERKVLEERVRNIEAWRHEQQAVVEAENKMADSELATCEAAALPARQHRDQLDRDILEGTTAMSADLEAFSGNIVQVIEHFNKELMELLTHTTQQIESEASTAITAEEQAGAQLAALSDDMLACVQACSQRALESVTQAVDNLASSTINSLTGINTTTSAAGREAASAHARVSGGVQQACARAARHHAELRAALQQHELLEAQRLEEEFALYQPTGATPVRQEYRFPRALAATSPHDRILARFRAMRQHSNEEVSIAVETERGAVSDSESSSSVSEDSALCEFTTPSPPAERAPSLNKCTSETDIYYRKPAGKENHGGLSSSRKTSRLPAPTSHKKPLIQRND